MSDAPLKQQIRERLWQIVDRHPEVLSATLAGSFVESALLEGISDIDLVLIVERLNAELFNRLIMAFDAGLAPVLKASGYALRINSTLGPLKFNDPATAVLHLMFYSRDAHVRHAIASPFTCLDWQRSAVHRGASLTEVYPVFGLQPRHFISARRSIQDYLKDFRNRAVSYRELICDDDGYREQPRTKPMTLRDAHEFAYHVLRFLMQNLLKLVHRRNSVTQGEALLAQYFAVFPQERESIGRFFLRLREMKQSLTFTEHLPALERQLNDFLCGFERQFKQAFVRDATRHMIFRHAATAANRRLGQPVFLGRSDPGIAPVAAEVWSGLADQIKAIQPAAAFSSPLRRCRESLHMLGGHVPLPPITVDDRLAEIDYGRVEGLTVAAARSSHAELFAAWQRREDPRFPEGENTADVAERTQAFATEWWGTSSSNTVTCSHNVAIRCLVGHALRVPMDEWHRIAVPHLAPIGFVYSRRFGLFADFHEETQRALFTDFERPQED
jgi:broad specificity phosphatase PhoE